MKRVSLPQNQNSVGWPLPSDSPSTCLALTGDLQADWAVIGAGYAGLAFARTLATLNPDSHIVVLDAASAPWDSSAGRNSGFVIGLPHNIGSSMAELKKAQTWRNLLQAGIEILWEQVEKHAIACDWENAGKYHCQVSEGSDAVLKTYRESLERIEEPYEELDGEALRRRLGSGFWHKGIFTPGTILVNPARLIAGLADSLPANVTLYQNTPALAIKAGDVTEIFTPQGVVKVKNVMLATNALSPELMPGRLRRQASMATFASLTQPLTVQQMMKLPREMTSWGMTPVNAIAGATVRFTSDRRFLIRQHVIPALRGVVTKEQTRQAARQHNALFNRIYPQLGGEVALVKTWSGAISVTRNGAPLWGNVARNIYTAAGCNGAGISRQTIAGELLAYYALKQDHPLIGDMLAVGRANLLPPSPLLDAAVKVSLMKERWLGRREA
ncbi:FAD-binding oxidoreductase [Enterobacteriaceae bacterium YMB-R22]|jgi:glycine/D-amino acid oxidase-like deaminating enzyme|uniref:NAD(P)/FAD-dependent oxidoreductase n=1 Tax=Tenebrionicola larvae TaxID=2815733 RepID=UPI002011423C|nr:FAD-binding oxidoreductase [Tenebrionicola larvae]MBV4412707.1 FAD-binding oxidoreductase [Tenebrionicola larvae]